MFKIEVVRCSDRDHKLKCMAEASEALRRAVEVPMCDNGRKVTIRGGITNPCTCHLDALLHLAAQAVIHPITSEQDFNGLFMWGQMITLADIMR